MSDKSALLGRLYQARFDELKTIAGEHGVGKNGSVETLRARLIRELVLDEWDLTPEGIRATANVDLGEILGVFGIKKSGYIKARRQRLYLHLNHDPKHLTPETLDTMNKDELHALCKALEVFDSAWDPLLFSSAIATRAAIEQVVRSRPILDQVKRGTREIWVARKGCPQPFKNCAAVS